MRSLSYRSFRTLNAESEEDRALCSEYSFNMSWLIRYYYRKGKSLTDNVELLKAARLDNRSRPKKKLSEEEEKT